MGRSKDFPDSENTQNMLPNTPLQEKYVGPPDGTVQTIGDEEEREVWGKKIDFLLSVVGFAVDLANVWRFPYLCYKNGGGAFLIPYIMMLVLAGIPLFYMELALGQYNRTGAITCWARICPLFKGIGWAVILIAFYTDFYYNVIIAWCLHFFFASFTLELPWTTCNNEWNTPSCYDGSSVDDNSSFISNYTSNFTFSMNRTSAAEEYFHRKMLEVHLSDGIFGVGSLKWQLVLCLLGVYLICYFSLWKGISTSGKVVWFTALFPYVVLFILMIRGATLPGAIDGVYYYLTPNFDRLKKSQVWVDAATQVFFSLGPGFGVLLAYASYNPKHNNVYRDAIVTSCINCATSFFSGFVIFMILGYMAKKSGLEIDAVAEEGPGLVFVVYPEAISTIPGSTFWAIIFFLMLLTLGLDSSFGGSEAIITAVTDEFPVLKKYREIFVGALFSVYFVVGLASCSQGGMYIVGLMDRYAAGYSILFAVFFETLAVSWAYGVERFSGDIEEMTGFRPGIYWKICWKYVAPLFLMFNIIFGLVKYEPLTSGIYKYPWESNLIGWGIALSSILCIPAFIIYGLISEKGSFMQRMRELLTPWRDKVNRSVEAANNIRLNGGGGCGEAV